MSDWCGSVQGLMSHSTHNRSFQTRVLSGNQFHWYWQPKTRKQNSTYTRNTKEKQKKLIQAHKCNKLATVWMCDTSLRSRTSCLWLRTSSVRARTPSSARSPDSSVFFFLYIVFFVRSLFTNRLNCQHQRSNSNRTTYVSVLTYKMRLR